MPFDDLLAQLAAGNAYAGSTSKDDVRDLLEQVYGERCSAHAHHRDAYQVRVNLQGKPDAASYAGWINAANPTSGPYQGTSLVWFPGEGGSVLVLVVGTQGFGEDAHILGRPGHARRLRALARLHDGRLWVKPDPLDLSTKVPDSVAEGWPAVKSALKTYGSVIYAAAPVRGEGDRELVEDLIDLFFDEHGTPLKGPAKRRWNERYSQALGAIFPTVEESEALELLRERRFVVLEGPPGTGKTRLANRLCDALGSATRVQFHPARTYEDFVIGLFPSPAADGLSFEVREGDLLVADAKAHEREHVLLVDEINRADLGRVLGEAVTLLEVGEQPRTVRLPHPRPNGDQEFSLSPRLHLLATRNTADRTIARMDIAIRRRFAFLDVWPDGRPIAEQGSELARRHFDDTLHTFAEYADEETLRLVPGHAYFLDPRPDLFAGDGDEPARDRRIANRLHYELLPLLADYQDERLLGAASQPVLGLAARIDADLRQRA